jgi:hypothetical protein
MPENIMDHPAALALFTLLGVLYGVQKFIDWRKSRRRQKNIAKMEQMNKNAAFS